MSDALTGKLGHLGEFAANDEVRQTAFSFAHDMGYMVFSTINRDGDPAGRGIEVHYLDDSGLLFIGMAPGKPMYFEMLRHTVVSGTAVQLTEGRLSESVRITASLEAVDPEKNPEIYERYWELNPGTKALYRKDLERFRIFKLVKGYGRTFHMAGDDIVQNHRFCWGGEQPREWAYEIDQTKCIGCGICAELCMMDVIAPAEGGVFRINHYQCLECGRCADVCPNGAVLCCNR